MRAKINTRCVASHYAAPNERIVEFSTPRGVGGLISIAVLDSGAVVVNVYRCDPEVQVVTNRPAPVGPFAEQREAVRR